MLVAFVLCSSLRLEAQEASFRVITHPDNPTTTLTRDEASRLFLRKSLTWKDGAKARPVDLGEKSQTRSSFSKEIHGKPMSSVKAYWINQLFAGRLDPPLEVKTDDDVLAFVRANPGAIGYVSTETPAKGVKILTIVGGS